jgi:hypothetical protein
VSFSEEARGTKKDFVMRPSFLHRNPEHIMVGRVGNSGDLSPG